MPNDVVNNAADGSSGLGEGQGRGQGDEEDGAEEFATRVRPSPPTPHRRPRMLTSMNLLDTQFSVHGVASV